MEGTGLPAYSAIRFESRANNKSKVLVLPPGEYGLLQKIRNTLSIFTHDIRPTLLGVVNRLPSRHPTDITYCGNFLRPVALVNNPSFMVPVLQLPRFGDKGIDGGHPWQILADQFGKAGVLSEKKEVHDAIKPSLSKYLLPNALMLNTLVRETVSTIEGWKGRATRSNPVVGIDLKAAMAWHACQSTLSFITGREYPENESRKLSFALEQISNFICWRIKRIPEWLLKIVSAIASWYYRQPSINQSRDLLNKVINNLKTAEVAPGSLIDGLRKGVKDGTYTEQDYVDTLTFLLFAGQDTTASGLASAMHLLSESLEWRNRISRELQQYKITKAEELTLENLDKMVELRNFVETVLHNHPPIWSQTRILREDRVFLDDNTGTNYLIRKGSMVAPIHDPAFRNFGDKSYKFGMGSSVCPGQKFAVNEMKVFVAIFLLNMVSIPNPKAPVWKWSTTHYIESDYQLYVKPKEYHYAAISMYDFVNS